MKKIELTNARGFLGELLSNLNKKELFRTANRMFVAARISEELKKRKIPKEKFALDMNVSSDEIEEWLSGDKNLTIDQISDIELELDIKLLNINK